MAAAGEFRTVAIEALRESIRVALDIKRHNVGGWEVVGSRDLTIGVYLHSGSFGNKPGGQLNSTDKVVIVANLQSGSAPASEEELYPLADALAVLLNRFTHLHVAGAKAGTWSLDIRQDKSFDAVVTVNGEIAFRTREQYRSDEQVLGLARTALASLIQESDHDPE